MTVMSSHKAAVGTGTCLSLADSQKSSLSSPPLRHLMRFIKAASKIDVSPPIIQKPGDHPNFRKNALGVKRPFSELSESSGVFSEQLSELEIPFSEYEIPFSEWPLTT